VILSLTTIMTKQNREGQRGCVDQDVNGEDGEDIWDEYFIPILRCFSVTNPLLSEKFVALSWQQSFQSSMIFSLESIIFEIISSMCVEPQHYQLERDWHRGYHRLTHRIKPPAPLVVIIVTRTENFYTLSAKPKAYPTTQWDDVGCTQATGLFRTLLIIWSKIFWTLLFFHCCHYFVGFFLREHSRPLTFGYQCFYNPIAMNKALQFAEELCIIYTNSFFNFNFSFAHIF